MENETLDRRIQVKKVLSRKGLTMKQFSSDHNISKSLIEGLINGKISGRIGKSHKIAVLLGLKESEASVK